MIRELDNDSLSLSLNHWGLIVGLNDGIDKLQKVVIGDFLRNFYGHYKVDEITEAFKLYAAQKLTFKDAVYNNMNPTFIGKVLAAYLEYKRENKLILNSSENVKLLKEPKEHANEGECAFEFIERNKEHLDSHYFIANWKAAFFHAKEIGILKLGKKKVEFLKDKVIASIVRERNKCKMSGRDPKYLSESSYLRNEYFRAAIMDFFKSN